MIDNIFCYQSNYLNNESTCCGDVLSCDSINVPTWLPILLFVEFNSSIAISASNRWEIEAELFVIDDVMNSVLESSV